ncbi:MAG: cell wall-active antibiotics response protein LiaF [Eubacteriales bacterium]|nr:cell wall-active antibiotics response protein LiaF [Eubacteriales bacterium]
MTLKISKTLVGTILVIVGGLYLLSNFGMIPLGLKNTVFNYWPVVIILWALYHLVDIILTKTTSNEKFNKIYGSISMMIVGLVLLENRINLIFDESIGLWSVVAALFIIFVGIRIIFFKSSDYEVENEQNFQGMKFNKGGFNAVGDLRLGDQPWALEDSSHNIGVGEIYVDLTTALLKDGLTVLNLSGWVGDIQVMMPEYLAVDISATVRVGNIDIFEQEQECKKNSKAKRSGVSNTLNYRSEKFDEALKKLRMQVSLNIGDISIKRCC